MDLLKLPVTIICADFLVALLFECVSLSCLILTFCLMIWHLTPYVTLYFIIWSYSKQAANIFILPQLHEKICTGLLITVHFSYKDINFQRWLCKVIQFWQKLYFCKQIFDMPLNKETIYFCKNGKKGCSLYKNRKHFI